MSVDTQQAPSSLPPLEVPTDELRAALQLAQPILIATIERLYADGFPGWAGYFLVFYQSIADVMVPQGGEG